MYRRWIATFSLSVGFVLAPILLVYAAVPTTIGYQGYLTDSGGTAQTGTATVTARLYDASTGGNLLYEEIIPGVSITNGYFSLNIGSVGDVNGTTAASALSDLDFSAPYYLTVALGSPFSTGEMTNGGVRTTVNATPYSYTAYGVPKSANSSGLFAGAGRLFFNTTDNSLYVYNGSSWATVGGSSIWPFSTADTNYGVAVQSTTTPEWFKNGVFASSTSHFVNIDFTHATSTYLASTIASTTQFTVSGQSGCATFTSGVLTGSGIACGSGSGVWPFTTGLTNYGVAVQATTTPLWLQAGLFASSSSAYPTLAVSQSGAGPVATFMGGNVGIGTTTPFWALTIANATKPQLTLVDTTSTSNAWTFRSISNSLYIATSSATATSSIPALMIRPAGATGYVGIGLTNPLYPLDVAGFINTDQYSGYKQAGSTILTASSSNGVTAVGVGALASNVPYITGGYSNTAVGYQALNVNSTSDYNTAVGFQALQNNTADVNTAVGRLAANKTTSGTHNLALGGTALYSNTVGDDNVAIGGDSPLYYNVLGNNNVAIGSNATYFNQSATNTVAVGYFAGWGGGFYSNQGSVAVGYEAGYHFSTGSDYNTLFGYQSGREIARGARNVLLGPSTIVASYNQVTTGSNNISIGNDVAIASSTLSNQLNIGNYIYGINLAGTGTTVSNATIGLGTTTPFWALTVASSTGPQLALVDKTLTSNAWTFRSISNSLYIATSTATATSTTAAFAIDPNGNSRFGSGTLTLSSQYVNCTALTTDANGVIGCIASDERIKQDVATLDASAMLQNILKLNPVSFAYRPDAGSLFYRPGARFGFLAQSAREAFPSIVSTTSQTELTPEGTLQVDYSQLIAPIIASIQELYRQIGDLAHTVAGFADVITTRRLCLDDVCITKEQLQELLANAHTSAAPAPAQAEQSDTVASSTDPVSSEQSGSDDPAAHTATGTDNVTEASGEGATSGDPAPDESGASDASISPSDNSSGTETSETVDTSNATTDVTGTESNASEPSAP